MLLSVFIPLAACASTALAYPTSNHAPFEARDKGIVVGNIPRYWKGIDGQLFVDLPTERNSPGSGKNVLNFDKAEDSSNTAARCIAKCTADNNFYAAVSGTSCRCGDDLYNKKAPGNVQAKACARGQAETCGNSPTTGRDQKAWQVYYDARAIRTTPSGWPVDLPDRWSVQVRDQSYRTPDGSPILAYKWAETSFSVGQCVSHCKSLDPSISIAAIKGGNECRCGTTSPDSISVSDAPVPCQGEASEWCGSNDGYIFYRDYYKVDRNLGPVNGYQAGGFEKAIKDKADADAAQAAADAAAAKAAADAAAAKAAADAAAAQAAADAAAAKAAADAAAAAAAAAARVVTLDYHGFTSTGDCVADNRNGRLLNKANTASYTDMTQEFCAKFCFEQGFQVAGLEYMRECWCSDALPATLPPVVPCSMTCTGNDEQICGDSDALLIFTTKETPAPKPVAPKLPSAKLSNGWETNGECVVDNADGRLLKGPSKVDSAMTYAMCTDFCFSQGFRVAGLEYSSECFCGTLPATTVDSTQCTMPCSGEQGTICGGANALVIFTTDKAFPVVAKPAGPILSSLDLQSNGWTTDGACVIDNADGRLLKGPSKADSAMTYAMCTDYCFSEGFQVAGVEYSSECFCGTLPASLTTSTQCSMPCAGDSTRICGGPDALVIFTTTQKKVTEIAVRPAVAPIGNSGWTNTQLCAAEIPNSRLLADDRLDSTGMTPELCVAYCGDKGFDLAGIEFSTECYCSMRAKFDADLSKLEPSTSCNMKCPNSNTICGGPNAISIYSKDTTQQTRTTATKQVTVIKRPTTEEQTVSAPTAEEETTPVVVEPLPAPASSD